VKHVKVPPNVSIGVKIRNANIYSKLKTALFGPLKMKKKNRNQMLIFIPKAVPEQYNPKCTQHILQKSLYKDYLPL